MEFKPTADQVKLTGRCLSVKDMTFMSYSGSTLSFTFTGKKAEAAIFSDSPDWEEHLKGWVMVYLNDETVPRKRILLDYKDAVYTLYESLEEETVTVHLVKISEAAFGKCGIRFLRIDTDKLLPPPAEKKHRIEIIGDSITCGYGVEAESGMEPFHTVIENPTKSYSLITAKMLKAEVNLVSWSGIGIISNWVPEDAAAPLDDWLMPMLYQYTDASTSKLLFGEDHSKWEKWNFKAFIPELIIINLGTNDTSYCKDIPERQEFFKTQYHKFVDDVAGKNPTAHILCVLGTMEQILCPIIEEVVTSCHARPDGSRFHYLHLPLQSEEDGKGADFHPSKLTHRKTAELIANEARKIMGWQREI